MIHQPKVELQEIINERERESNNHFWERNRNKIRRRIVKMIVIVMTQTSNYYTSHAI